MIRSLCIGLALTGSATASLAGDSIPVVSGDGNLIELASYPGGVLKTQSLQPLSATDGEIVGLGDIDGDGRAELVLQNFETGQVSARKVGAGTLGASTKVSDPVGTVWRLSAIGDVDGDGTDDLIWQHDNGQVHYWKMLGGKHVAGADIGTPVDDGWTLIGAGHFDGGAEDDIVWQHSAGQVHVWVMSQGTRLRGMDIISGQEASGVYFDTVCDLDGDGRDEVVSLGGTPEAELAFWKQGLTRLGAMPSSWLSAAHCG